jgi:hypothetical protein
MARRLLIGLVALTGVAAIDGATAETHASMPGMIVESARTAAHGVRDGVLTLARTTRAFVLGGAPAAEDTWYDNVEATREHARRNADRVREETRTAAAPIYRSRDDDREHYYRDDDRYERDGERYDRDDRYDRRDEPLPPATPDDDLR